MPSAAQLAADKIASYREPGGCTRFAYDQFGFEPDPFQKKLFDAFEDPKVLRISLQACAGPGKTAGMAVCAWYFLATQCSYEGGGFEHPKGFATSITEVNLRDNLWSEIAKWQDRSDWLRTSFRWGGERIAAIGHEATWFLAARTWPKSGSADEQGRTFSGLHGRNVGVFIDESGSIPPTVLRAAEQALANTRFAKVLQSGNPISTQGMLYEATNRLRDLWTVIVVTGDPADPEAWVHSPRVDHAAEGQLTPKEWAQQQIDAYGRDNPWVMSYILGQFPPTSLNALFSHQDVMEAMARDPQPPVYEHMQKRIGIDVARFGDDRTVLFPRQGLKAFQPHVMRGADTNEIVARVLQGVERFGSELELIDNSFAWGNGVLDNLHHAGRNAHPVNFAGKAVNFKLYGNRRAEMWLEGRKFIIERGGCLPDVPGLVAELTEPTYMFSNGVFMLEPKDIIKKRLGRSTDLADAYMLTHALPDLPSNVQSMLRSKDGARPGHAATEYDPYARRA